MYQISLSDFNPEGTPLSQSYMDTYRLKADAMSQDLAKLLEAVLLTPQDLPMETLVFVGQEPAFIRLARKVNLVKTPPTTFEVRGVYVQQHAHAALLIKRNGLSGRPQLMVLESIKSRRVDTLDPDTFVFRIITDRHWIGMTEAMASFAQDYRSIATLLPEGHALRAYADELIAEAAKLREKQAARA